MKFETLLLFLGEFEVKKFGLAFGTFLPLLLLPPVFVCKSFETLVFGLLEISLLTTFFVEFTGLTTYVFERIGLFGGIVILGLFVDMVLNLLGLFGRGLFLSGLFELLRSGLFERCT